MEKTGRNIARYVGIAWASCVLSGCDLDESPLLQEALARRQAANTANGESLPNGQGAAPPAAGWGAGMAVPTGTQGQYVSARVESTVPTGFPNRTAQTLLISSFNIQAFGEKKVSDSKVVTRLAAIIQLFDVVAIQEVRAKDQTVIQRLLGYVNAQGARYDYVLGPRLGRSDSKEQYCFVYDSARVASSPQASYTINDDADLLHRECLVARFATRVPAGYPPFTFSLVNIHTDPDEVKQEIPVMHTVLRGVREYEWATAREDDVMMMGDLNAEPKQFGPLAQVPGIYWIIQSQPTNTRRTKIYDNILFDRALTQEFTGRAGVLDMAEMFRISTEEALTLSDHQPIWAEFSIVEQPAAYGPAVANQGNSAAVR